VFFFLFYAMLFLLIIGAIMNRQLIIYLAIIFLIIITDRLLKRYFIKKYGFNVGIRLNNKRYNIYVTKNPGAFLGLGKKYQALVSIFGIILLVVLIIYCIASNEPPIKKYALAAMASAAFSNLTDRLIYKGVIDYFCIRLLGKKIIINFADAVIFLSAGIYVIFDFFYK